MQHQISMQQQISMQRKTLCCSQKLLVLKLKNAIAEALLKIRAEDYQYLLVTAILIYSIAMSPVGTR